MLSWRLVVLPIATAVIGFLLGLGGLQELFVRGIWNGELQPLLIGAFGALVSAMLLVAALAMWRKWSQRPRIAAIAGALSIAFHVYGALPPERNVGLLAMTLGVGIGIALLVYAIRRREPPLELIRR
jgi:hypothetical protein